MVKWFLSFYKEEKGAVTVDWVMMTAAVVGIAIVAFLNIQSGSNTMSEQVGTYLADKDLDELRNPNN